MRRGIALLLALLLSGASMASLEWPTLPWPDGLRPQVIAEDMRFNGNDIRLYRFERDGHPAQVAAQFQTALGRRARVTVVGQRHIVAAPVGASFVTVDLQPQRNGIVIGHVMQTHLKATAASISPPMPADSRLWNHTHSRDGARTATLFMLENRHSALVNIDFYRQHFQSQGMTALASRDTELFHAATIAHFAAKSQSAVVMVEDWGDFRTVIVQHNREAP